MVYFGNKNFRAARPGMTRTDRRKLMIPAFILIGVVGLYLTMNFGKSSTADLPKEFEVSIVTEDPPVESREEREAGIRVTSEDVPDVPPLTDLNDEPEPFKAMPELLLPVPDDGNAEGVAEQLGLWYLFHRWRAGPDVPVEEEFPDLQTVDKLSSQMRGRRYRLVVRPRMSPFYRDLPENQSGVRRYWEAWCEDGRAMYRILFIDKDPDMILDSNTEWTVVCDFLRIHQYERTDGGFARVPEMVALKFEEPRQILDGDTSWLPLVVSAAIGGVGVLFLFGLWLRQEHGKQTRRGQFKMGKKRNHGGNQ